MSHPADLYPQLQQTFPASDMATAPFRPATLPDASLHTSLRLRRSSATSDSTTASFRSATPCNASLPDMPVPISHLISCSICMDVLGDPVTTTCGHTYCKPCLDRHLTLNDLVCPLCKQYLLMRPGVNILLKSILEEYNKAQKSLEEFTLAPDEVACDICPENRKRKAVKSCLMCLLSYCTRHLKRHQNKLRLKGHKLVAPVEKLDERACLAHGRPLELFWAKEDKCICSLCVEEVTEVVSVETERGRRERELVDIIQDMEQRIQQREEKVKEFERSKANCLALIDREQEEIKEVFDAVRDAVARAEEEALSALKDKRRSVENEEKQFKQELQREVTAFSKVIADLKKITEEEDHILFLQSYPSVPAPDNGKDWTNVAMDTDLTFGTMRNTQTSMMSDIETELEKLSSIEIERIKKFAVDVTLDPDTAHAQLLVSDDGKEVKDSGERKDVPDIAERFDMFGSVLGQNSLTEGKAFWVVDVGDKQGWDIGGGKKRGQQKGEIVPQTKPRLLGHCALQWGSVRSSGRPADSALSPRQAPESQLVYLRNHAAGRNKIQDYWGSWVYQVVRQPPGEGVVYSVVPAYEDGPIRQDHRTEMRAVPEGQQNIQEGVSSTPNTDTSESESSAEDDSEESLILCHARNPQEHESVFLEPPDEVMVPLEDMPLRCSSRFMAGRHSNHHRLPRAVYMGTHPR
ncbi:hypothetical protein AOLI_G00193300 [Acnodon oligacanthus]